MKHLLKALEGRLNVQASGQDLNSLLADIRDSKESKNSESFYDTLDKVLHELRITEQAAAFLRPVRKAEAPDYDLVIKHPMDLQTMQKKVKSHAYKNKQDFASDLNLIWENCLTYNSDPNHPLRRAAIFMRKKADHMMERITDKNERPSTLNVRLVKPPPQHYSKSRTIESSDEEDTDTPLANGRVNGQVNGTMVNGTGPKVNGVVAPAMPNGKSGHEDKRTTVQLGKRRARPREDVPFLERPALVRTPEGMGSFRDVDIEMQRYLDSEGAGPSRPSSDALIRHQLSSRVQKKLKTLNTPADGQVNVLADHYAFHMGVEAPRSPLVQKKMNHWNPSAPAVPSESQVLGEWWQAMSDPKIQVSGVPEVCRPVEDFVPQSKTKRKQPHRKRAKRPPRDLKPTGLRGIMESNIMTLRKLRKTHSKILALQAGEEVRPQSPEPPDIRRITQKWDVPIPLEGGAELAKTRMNSVSRMMLEHAGFDGTSKGALDVVSDVGADFIMTMGRTLRFYTDKYGQTMTPEELILHALFEQGTMEIQSLERYIKDDVERYGNKIAETERKLHQVYEESVSPTVVDPEGLMDDDDMFASGGMFGGVDEDFFGFGSLGILAENGVSALRIPTKLWRGQKGQNAAAQVTNEPPPPYPPPPPFLPVSQNSIDTPIGLLQSFYREKFEKIAGPAAPTADGLPLPSPSALTLADDLPDPLKIKSGPLGNITLPTATNKPKPTKPPGPGKGNGKKKSDDTGSGNPPSGPPGPGPVGGNNSNSTSTSAPPAPAPASASTNANKGQANPSPAKKPKTNKKNSKAPTAPSETHQAGPIVMATA